MSAICIINRLSLNMYHKGSFREYIVMRLVVFRVRSRTKEKSVDIELKPNEHHEFSKSSFTIGIIRLTHGMIHRVEFSLVR